jgi:hypothetical protein
MKRQSFIGIATTLFCLCQLGNIDKVHAVTNVCTGMKDVEDGCLKINETALKNLQIEISQIVSNTNTKLIVPDGTPLDSSPTPIVNSDVSFKIDNLWELKVPLGSQGNLQVEYNTLQKPNLTGSEMLVNIQKLITTRESTSDPTNFIIVRGGVTITFNLSNIKVSGNYLGNLQIEVTPPP